MCVCVCVVCVCVYYMYDGVYYICVCYLYRRCPSMSTHVICVYMCMCVYPTVVGESVHIAFYRAQSDQLMPISAVATYAELQTPQSDTEFRIPSVKTMGLPFGYSAVQCTELYVEMKVCCNFDVCCCCDKCVDGVIVLLLL